MKPYNKFRFCPRKKCAAPPWLVRESYPGPTRILRRPRIRRSCVECGKSWNEKP